MGKIVKCPEAIEDLEAKEERRRLRWLRGAQRRAKLRGRYEGMMAGLVVGFAVACLVLFLLGLVR